jgi:hypothetical protein
MAPAAAMIIATTVVVLAIDIAARIDGGAVIPAIIGRAFIIVGGRRRRGRRRSIPLFDVIPVRAVGQSRADSNAQNASADSQRSAIATPAIIAMGLRRGCCGQRGRSHDAPRTILLNRFMVRLQPGGFVP